MLRERIYCDVFMAKFCLPVLHLRGILNTRDHWHTSAFYVPG